VSQLQYLHSLSTRAAFRIAALLSTTATLRSRVTRVCVFGCVYTGCRALAHRGWSVAAHSPRLTPLPTPATRSRPTLPRGSRAALGKNSAEGCRRSCCCRTRACALLGPPLNSRAVDLPTPQCRSCPAHPPCARSCVRHCQVPSNNIACCELFARRLTVLIGWAAHVR